MGHAALHTGGGKCLVLAVGFVLAVASGHVFAQDITGAWDMTMEFGGRPSYATLTVSRNPDGTLAGRWGSEALSNVRFEGQRLTFTRTLRMGNQEFTMDYAGTLRDGKIAGLMSSNRGEFPVDGVRVRPKSPAIGQWNVQYAMGQRDITGTLTISDRPDGTLVGTWTGARGESQISHVRFHNGVLTFDRTSRFNDREFTSTFEGPVQDDRLTGAFKSQRGEAAATGQRIGAALIGKWELTTSTDRGPRTRVLTIYPDLTGRYEWFGGAEIPIRDLTLEDDQVAFAIETAFGDQTFRTDFRGRLQGEALSGQSTSQRGSVEFTGRKVKQVSPLVGTWEFTRETQRGVRTSTLTIREDMTGAYVMRNTEIPITDLKIDGDQVSFRAIATFNEQQFPVEFRGRCDGATLTGEFITAQGTLEATGRKAQ